MRVFQLEKVKSPALCHHWPLSAVSESLQHPNCQQLYTGPCDDLVSTWKRLGRRFFVLPYLGIQSLHIT